MKIMVTVVNAIYYKLTLTMLKNHLYLGNEENALAIMFENECSYAILTSRYDFRTAFKVPINELDFNSSCVKELDTCKALFQLLSSYLKEELPDIKVQFI